MANHIQRNVAKRTAKLERHALQGLHGTNLRLPNFLCVGAPQAGTTWLYHNLSLHPDACIPLKEPKYFDKNLTRRPLLWYARLYKKSDALIVGDMSTSYIRLHPDGIRLVKSLIPTAKILCLVRNPVERAWSGYRRWAYRKQEPSSADVERYLEWTAFAFQSWGGLNLEYSFYTTALTGWLRVFGRHSVSVLSYETLRTTPEAFLYEVLTSLGLNALTQPWEQVEYSKINVNPTLSMPDDIADMLSERYSGEHQRLQALLETNEHFW